MRAACRGQREERSHHVGSSDTPRSRGDRISNPCTGSSSLWPSRKWSLTSSSARPPPEPERAARSSGRLDDNFDYSSLLCPPDPHPNTQARQILSQSTQSAGPGHHRRLDECGNLTSDFRVLRGEAAPARDAHRHHMMPGSAETLPAGFPLTAISSFPEVAPEVLYEALDDVLTHVFGLVSSRPSRVLLDSSTVRTYFLPERRKRGTLNCTVLNRWLAELLDRPTPRGTNHLMTRLPRSSPPASSLTPLPSLQFLYNVVAPDAGAKLSCRLPLLSPYISTFYM
ncbi:liprin-alpha-2 isoform X1 [Lates japonicus]|uniref:Liprin-alpha-2 isoform X1 n=1 Tax=Lates japonicus TaxID=270547 RepID=A0AAD3M640_LATJO|nr:liprin-alpha-2 isoform X1 [Lates japonicus]